MNIVFLGTNGWYDSKTGNTICTLIETEERYIILDAGSGISKADRYMDEEKPADIFLSHFHLDHITGLHTLAKFSFPKGLRIYGQIGTEEVLETIINRPYTIPIGKLPYKACAKDLKEGIHKLPYKVECRALLHSETCFGYRFEIDEKVIAYCTDTGICKNALKLAMNADLLIAECSFKSGQSNPAWPHLNPEEAIDLANRAKAKSLALTHFDAAIYKTIKERRDTEKKTKKRFWNGNVLFASDDKNIII